MDNRYLLAVKVVNAAKRLAQLQIEQNNLLHEVFDFTYLCRKIGYTFDISYGDSAVTHIARYKGEIVIETPDEPVMYTEVARHMHSIGLME